MHADTHRNILFEILYYRISKRKGKHNLNFPMKTEFRRYMGEDHQFQNDDMKGNMTLLTLLDIPTTKLKSTSREVSGEIPEN